MTEKRVDIVIGGKNLSNQAFDQVQKNAENLRRKMTEVQSGKGFTDFAVQGLAAIGSVEGGLRVVQSLSSAFRGDFEGALSALERLPFGLGAIVTAIKDIFGGFAKVNEESKKLIELQRQIQMAPATSTVQRMRELTMSPLEKEIATIRAQAERDEDEQFKLMNDLIKERGHAGAYALPEYNKLERRVGEIADARDVLIQEARLKAVDEDLTTFFDVVKAAAGEREKAIAAELESFFLPVKNSADTLKETVEKVDDALERFFLPVNNAAKTIGSIDDALADFFKDVETPSKKAKVNPLTGGVDLGDALGFGFSNLAGGFHDDPQRKTERTLSDIHREIMKLNESFERAEEIRRRQESQPPIVIRP